MSLVNSLHPRRRWKAFAPICCGLVFCLAATIGVGAESAKQFFDIPAGAGDQALKRFAAQSGIEVVFGTTTTAEVKTNAVKGEYAPREAIARLLEGTGLMIVPNEKTGALTVSRDPNGQRAAQDKTGDRPIHLHPISLAKNALNS